MGRKSIAKNISYNLFYINIHAHMCIKTVEENKSINQSSKEMQGDLHNFKHVQNGKNSLADTVAKLTLQ